MDDPLAVETLARFYETETSPDVKLTAAATLSRMPPTSEGVSWAGQTIQKGEEKMNITKAPHKIMAGFAFILFLALLPSIIGAQGPTCQ